MKHVYYYQTVLGKIGIGEEGQAVTDLFFCNEQWIPDRCEITETNLIYEAYRQVEEYLSGERKEFDLPISTYGTPFQQSVWRALLDIPYGQTRSYKNIAETIGRKKAYRAVGLANNRNPISIIIPCHRVIGASGHLVGYGGGLEIKKYLLGLESEGFIAK